MTTTETEIRNLRRAIAGLSLKQLAQRADLPYARAWKLLSGGAPSSPAEAASIDAALDVAELELEDARRALAVLRGSFSQEA